MSAEFLSHGSARLINHGLFGFSEDRKPGAIVVQGKLDFHSPGSASSEVFAETFLCLAYPFAQRVHLGAVFRPIELLEDVVREFDCFCVSVGFMHRFWDGPEQRANQDVNPGENLYNFLYMDFYNF
uniref:Selenoprotein O n=1 Tax=Steinernema glaseri TaxID=37863 RepID=A0A1I7YU73_9BILA